MNIVMYYCKTQYINRFGIACREPTGPCLVNENVIFETEILNHSNNMNWCERLDIVGPHHMEEYCKTDTVFQRVMVQNSSSRLLCRSGHTQINND